MRLFWLSAGRCGRRPVSLRWNHLRSEPLETRTLLTAVAGAESATECSTTSLVADPLLEVAGEVLLYRHGQVVDTFSPADDTDADRGDTLRSALAAAQFGDEVVLGAAIYDVGDTELLFPTGVTVTGQGKSATKITTSCEQSLSGGTVLTLDDQSVVQNLWLDGSIRDGRYQILLGGGHLGHDVDAYLRNIKVTADSDGIYVWGTSTYHTNIYGYNVDITTNYDAVALLGSGLKQQSVRLYDSTLSVSQPDPIPAHISNCVNLRSGFVGLYNCTLTATGDENSLLTNGVSCYENGSAEISNTMINASAPAGSVQDLRVVDQTVVTVSGGQGSGPGGSYVSDTRQEVYVDAVPATVVNRAILYNNSNYDDHNPLPNLGDAAAVATDKVPLLPGASSSFDNVISYDKGINSLALDLAGIHGSVTADDFVFSVGNNNAPWSWAAAPAPRSVVVLNGAGFEGSDRVVISWDDGAIVNTWLQVAVRANVDTGLGQVASLPAGFGDLFFWGSAVADTGEGNAIAFVTNANDELAIRNHPAAMFPPLDVANTYDINRDGKVDAADTLLARNNANAAFSALQRIVISSLDGEESLVSAELLDELAGLNAAIAADADEAFADQADESPDFVVPSVAKGPSTVPFAALHPRLAALLWAEIADDELPLSTAANSDLPASADKGGLALLAHGAC